MCNLKSVYGSPTLMGLFSLPLTSALSADIGSNGLNLFSIPTSKCGLLDLAPSVDTDRK